MLDSVWKVLKRRMVACFFLILGTIVCSFILIKPWIPNDGPANRCLAMYTLILLFYMGNVMPFHVISLLTPMLVVLFRVMRDQSGQLLPPNQAASAIVINMLDSIALIVLGSFCLAVAMKKYKIASLIGLRRLLNSISSPSLLCFVLMGLVLAGSFLMGSSPVSFLFAGVTLEILGEKYEMGGSDESTIPKALLMGIVSAGTIGSMASPISSPNSNFAYYEIHSIVPGLWWPWLIASIPTTILATILAWAINIRVYNLLDQTMQSKLINARLEDPLPRLETTNPDSTMNEIYVHGAAKQTVRNRQSKDQKCDQSKNQANSEQANDSLWPVKQTYVIIISITTAIGLLFSPLLRPYTGNMGIISLFPVIMLFGPGLLETKHLYLLRWDIVLLCLGGVAMTEAVQSSHLIHTLTRETLSILSYGNFYAQLILLTLLVTISAILKSRFVTAFVILPIIASLVAEVKRNGLYLDKEAALGHTKERLILYMACTFACSAGQALATSGIISTAISASSDRNGKPYLSQWDFVKVGLPTSALTFLCIVTISCLVMYYVWPVLFPALFVLNSSSYHR